MPYLESLEELDIFKVIGLIEICKVIEIIYMVMLYIPKKIFIEPLKNY